MERKNIPAPVIPAQAGIQWCATGFRVKPGMTGFSTLSKASGGQAMALWSTWRSAPTAATRAAAPTRRHGRKPSRGMERNNIPAPVIPAQAGIQRCATGFRVKPGMTVFLTLFNASGG
jgi:hypothetical protein